ncbi:metallophosphoesterase [Desulfoplanes sp.]
MDTTVQWIALGDIHENLTKLPGIAGLDKAEHVLISGDLTNCGDRRKAAGIIEKIRSYNPRILAQIGNMDLDDVDRYFTEQGMNTHARVVELGHGVCLIGMGYSLPTPFHTPSEKGEDIFREWLDQAHASCGEYEHLILMSHNPPFDTDTDRIGTGAHVGSHAVRAFIEKVQPDVCITGHIHESRAVDRIGETVIVNPGAFASGGYVVVEKSGNALRVRLEQAQ